VAQAAVAQQQVGLVRHEAEAVVVVAAASAAKT
jgi:hypothetical protein